MYFEGGHSSVYFFETDSETKEGGFGATFLIHKDVDRQAAATKGLEKGWWDSVHVFDVSEVDSSKKIFNYKLTTSVIVSMGLRDGERIGSADLSGTMTKQLEKKCPIDPDHSHVSNLGGILEDMELSIRNAIEGIYIQKTREVINGIRSASAAKEKQWESLVSSLNAAVISHAQKGA